MKATATAVMATILFAIASLSVARAQTDSPPITGGDAERAGILPYGGAPGAPLPEARPSVSTSTPAAPIAETSSTPSAPDSGPSPIAASSPAAAPGSDSSPMAASSPVAAATPAAAPSAEAHASPEPAPAPDASSSGALSRPDIKSPSAPALPASGVIISGTAPSTQEIPQAVEPDNATVSPNSGTEPIPQPTAGSEPLSPNEIANYQQSQNPEQDPKLGTLREFMAEGDETSSIGVEVRETHRKLKSGEEADGLLVMQVFSGSPAEQAGLKPLKRTTHNVLSGAAIAAAMIFPPAIMVLPILDYTQVGESYDMIIGVDGSRVTNFMDFEERMRTAQPGQIVYLSVVRNGVRTQLPVSMPQATTAVAK